MAYYIARIEVLVDVDNESEACDCMNEMLRPQLKTFDPESPVIDWRYTDSFTYPRPHSGEGFEYAEVQQ